MPGYPEAAQRADIIKGGDVDEWYVESQRVTRTDFIKHLRPGDTAVVAHMGCLAKANGKIASRLADLLEARGDIHAKGCFIVDAEGMGWLTAKQKVKAFMLAQRSIKNGSVRKYNFTNAQILRIIEVRDLKKYTNDAQRLARLKKDGIDCGRTYMVTTAPQIARDRGLV